MCQGVTPLQCRHGTTLRGCRHHASPDPTTEGETVTTTHEPLAASFDAAFGGTISTPGDPDYDTARAIWNGVIDGHPAVIAHCASAADVVAAVNLTRTAGVPLAIRAGGHSPPRFSSRDDGVGIHLSRVRPLTLRPGPGPASRG